MEMKTPTARECVIAFLRRAAGQKLGPQTVAQIIAGTGLDRNLVETTVKRTKDRAGLIVRVAPGTYELASEEEQEKWHRAREEKRQTRQRQAESEQEPQSSSKEIVPITMVDLQVIEPGELPRINGSRLAARLDYGQKKHFDEFVKENMPELLLHGMLPRIPAASVNGQTILDFWPNEPQSLVLTMRSGAKGAPVARKEIIDVYMAWRQGKMGQSDQPHFDARELATTIVREMMGALLPHLTAKSDMDVVFPDVVEGLPVRVGWKGITRDDVAGSVSGFIPLRVSDHRVTKYLLEKFNIPYTKRPGRKNMFPVVPDDLKWMYCVVFDDVRASVGSGRRSIEPRPSFTEEGAKYIISCMVQDLAPRPSSNPMGV